MKYNSVPGQISALAKLGKLELESDNIEAAIQITTKRLNLIPEEEVEMKALALSDMISIYRKTNQMVRDIQSKNRKLMK